MMYSHNTCTAQSQIQLKVMVAEYDHSGMILPAIFSLPHTKHYSSVYVDGIHWKNNFMYSLFKLSKTAEGYHWESNTGTAPELRCSLQSPSDAFS